ncbi:hypothetical protein PR202_gb18243 [Eleusine coracana subsp. coracana]|uniref:Tify domain-containing protein n=1 Tax=Eleusine coracana subsp. coracana TaxID=191504 RepID=A0AAV5F4E6_ELECO|nr:hypothetical protein PR202_gb18243 [Eleusine coracana subsp. coracana]
MSKKVACLTKHPGNIRELLNTGLLEGVPVISLCSKVWLLVAIYNAFVHHVMASRLFSAYYFEQHAGSTKKHPADYIYLGNGNSLRDVLRACERSPLEALEKTIRSSVDPVITSILNCLNCDENIPPSSQTEYVLCHGCLESKQPSDTPTPSHAYKSNSRDTGLHKLVFNVLLDGTEVAYYVDGEVSPSAFEAHAGEGSRRKPYDNIFTSNGVSLHELSMKISKDMGRSERETDDLCRECGLGGDIFPCKICPRSFHPACVLAV